MVKINDNEIKKWIKIFKRRINLKYNPEKMILFGSRARKDNLLESDLDLLIVSKKFRNVKWPTRIGDVSELWPGLIDLEPLCYTPEEFEKKKKEHGIVRQVIVEGIDF